MRGIRAPSGQRGMVLVLVLWVVVLVTALAGAALLATRVEVSQARGLVAQIQARYAAEAGLHRAAFELRASDPERRWLGDGRTYQTRIGEADLEIQIVDETGKLDLNGADHLTLASFFQGSGLTEREALALASRIVDWRDPDDLVTEPGGAEADGYRQARLRHVPRNQPFGTVNELMQVLGVDYDIFRRLAPSLTIHSGMNRPSANYAELPTLLALFPNLPALELENFVARRQQLRPGQTLSLPDGTTIVVQGGGLSFTVRSSATVPDGTRASLEATIQLGVGSVAGRPFRILRWRDDES